MFIKLVDEKQTKKYFSDNYIEYPKAFFSKYKAEDGKIYILLEEVCELLTIEKVDSLMSKANSLYANAKFVKCVLN